MMCGEAEAAGFIKGKKSREKEFASSCTVSPKLCYVLNIKVEHK